MAPTCQYLTDSSSIVLAPRFSPAGDRILYTSYETGLPAITLMDVGRLERRTLEEQPGTMTFAPRFSPDGGRWCSAWNAAAIPTSTR
jgi:TolB protein